MSDALTRTRLHVGAVADFENGDRRLIRHSATAIGVFRIDDGFVAYENNCPHQGGPVCEGRYFPLIKSVTTEDGRVLAEMHDKTKPHLVCPWHGWEYDLRTGEFGGNRNIRLRSFETQIEKGQVYVCI